MAAYPFTPEDLEALRQWDTPTICGAAAMASPCGRWSPPM
jgi:hypothetical protein